MRALELLQDSEALLVASSRHVTEFNPFILPKDGVWLRILQYFGRDDFTDEENDDDYCNKLNLT